MVINSSFVDVWNDNWPSGTPVIVIKDDGETVATKTRSTAWVMDCGEAMIMLEGQSGGYLLSRVVPLAP